MPNSQNDCEIHSYPVNRDAFVKSTEDLGLELSSEQVDRFAEFEDELYTANEVMNLTRVPKEECYIRHFLDSLMVGSVIAKLAPGGQVLDIGTGPGFPSWCLAVAFPDMDITALDSNGKMTGFLRKHAPKNLLVAQERAEEWEAREKFDVVTGRAVAPLNIQIEISAAPVKMDGYVVPMRTPQDDLTREYWKKVGLELIEVKEMTLPETDIVRVFPIFQKTRPTFLSFPRKWGDIKRKPL